ncbi:unnamed protein product [Camellia sinensis]
MLDFIIGKGTVVPDLEWDSTTFSISSFQGSMGGFRGSDHRIGLRIAWFLDQFGVLHDGQQPYPGAISTLERLATSGAKMVIISNSSRRASITMEKLKTLGFDPSMFLGAITSGELTHQYLQRRSDDWFAALGRSCIHMTWSDRGAISLEYSLVLKMKETSVARELGFNFAKLLEIATHLLMKLSCYQSGRNCSSSSWRHVIHPYDTRIQVERKKMWQCHANPCASGDGLGLQVVENVEEAEFILAHGTEALGLSSGTTFPMKLEDLEKILEQCAAKNIPMVVANPDFVTVEARALRVMPGTLAAKYEKLGGEVKWMGKPDEKIYKSAMAMAGVDVGDCIAVGDSLHHDIKGANIAGIQSAFITGGIHASELGLRNYGELADSSSVQALALKYDAHPSFVLPAFMW